MRKAKFKNTAVITIPNVPRPVRQGLLVSILILIFSALALRDVGAQVTTTTTNTTIVVGLTLPYGVQILTGTATSPATGAPARHLWTGDQGGLCRIDPDLDSPGPFAVNPATCITGVSGNARFTAGRMAFDPLTNNIYTVDNGSAQSVARYHYVPDGDSGQGLVSSTAEFLGDANGCGLSSNFPWAISLGPDGDLYIGFRKNGNVVRVLAPQSASVPCANMQVMGHGFDQKITKALAWIGHDLWGQDVIGLWRIANADQCFTPANNFTPCAASSLFRALVPNGFSMATDQAYPATNGNNLYSFDATGTSIALISGLGGTNLNVNTTYATSIVTGLTIAIDNADPARQILYLGADPGVDAAGAGPTGTVIKVAPNGNVVPGTPVNASAAPGNGQATVSWAPGGGGAPTSYLVHNSFASNGVTVPDVTVSAPAGFSTVPTSVVVSGLSNGFSYQFQISSSNAFGTSGFSTPSNLVTPLIPVAPSAPGTVVAAGGNAQATVAWSKPASDGGSPINSYSITAYVGGVPAGIGLFVAAPATSGTVTGLTNGTTYTFTVHATNAVGNSPESLPSNPVTPVIPLGPTDMAITMAGPASDNAGGNASYTLTVTNLGPNFAPTVSVSDPLPNGTTFVSATTTQGICTAPSTTTSGAVRCLLSSMLPGASATITVTLNLQATTTNTASVQAFDAAGAPLSDPNPANNAASFTTSIGPPPSTTDIQVTGAAQNGGPAVGTVDTFTWQVKDNLSFTANEVTFVNTLPPALQFASVSSNTGICQGPVPGTAGTISCTAPVGGGQTMIVTVNVIVASAGTIPVTGSAILNGTDINPANNSFTVTINAK